MGIRSAASKGIWVFSGGVSGSLVSGKRDRVVKVAKKQAKLDYKKAKLGIAPAVPARPPPTRPRTPAGAVWVKRQGSVRCVEHFWRVCSECNHRCPMPSAAESGAALEGETWPHAEAVRELGTAYARGGHPIAEPGRGGTYDP